MVFLVRVRLAVMGQDPVGILPMQAQRVFKQCGLCSERSKLGRLAHRPSTDSIP
jgi:hypothetical protein